MTEQRLVQILVSSGALGALWLHKSHSIEVDNITLVLLGLAAIPWLAPLIKSVKVPGVGEVEFQDLKKKVTEVSGIANEADHKAKLAKDEVDEIALFVFESLINKKEVEILKGLAVDSPCDIGEVRGRIADRLYQLRDSELISMGSISDLEGRLVRNLHDHAKITEQGRKYLSHLRRIEKAQSNK